ncbi:agarase [Botrimarina sp.]|uniref:agarase n=1 Tax=Botrimarina sp. TaxID=2795802 RepID=UPI0032EE57FE
MERQAQIDRRRFGWIAGAAALAAAARTRGEAPAGDPAAWRWLDTTQTEPEGAFRLARRGDRTWLVTPDGAPFFSVGMNHIDPATLRYPEHGDLLGERYGGDVQRWLRERVGPDLREWGFNSIGNTVEMASNGATNHKQSRYFTRAEYNAIGLPYCHQLPFAEFHHWDAQNRKPDFFAPEFADWCDYVAREYCSSMADDPDLIGYFYVDCPSWVHTHPHSRWRGPLFDPARLASDEGRRELFDLATQYYRVTHDAVRRYDPHHLILGDRYEGRGRMAEEVLQAAKPYVDVLSFQNFGEPDQIRDDLDEWAGRIGMPVLLADSGGKHVLEDGSHRHDTEAYRRIMDLTLANPECVGFHLCGAYMKNRIRRKGLLYEDETPDQPVIDAITRVNREAAERVDRMASEST